LPNILSGFGEGVELDHGLLDAEVQLWDDILHVLDAENLRQRCLQMFHPFIVCLVKYGKKSTERNYKNVSTDRAIPLTSSCVDGKVIKVVLTSFKQ